ncbi:MAG: hypothetical protein V1847_03805 [Candidatus Diapherotrites archaeon]
MSVQSKLDIAAFGILAVALIVSVLNFAALSGVQTSAANAMAAAAASPSTGLSGASSGSSSAASTISFSEIQPKGVPAVYGAELGISYDDISASNPQKADATDQKLASLENSISLDGNALARYILITNSISCEYCCGAPAITTADGSPACGCAHSGAMRGLAKYLIKQHGSEFSDIQILEELGKWKTLYFPSNMVQKANVLDAQGIALNFVSLASNQYRGIEQGATVSQGSTQQVGGC